MLANSITTLIVALAAAVSPVLGHIEMVNPAPFLSKNNPNTPQSDIDYSYTSPLDASGANYPCKGHHRVLGTDAGKSVATWAPGSTQNIQLGGTATHGGGSCQLMLSYDGGNSYKVIQSILGECPTTSGWSFTVPSDAPSGEAVFAWTWFNRLGNREMYMNCAAVTIGGGGNWRRDDESVYSNITRRGPSYHSGPDLFRANIGNGCGTEEGGDVEFPNPGPEVLRRPGFSPRAPTGSCAGGGGGGGQQPKPEPSAAPEPSSSSNGGEWGQPEPTPSNGGEWNQPAPSSSSNGGENGGEWNKPSATTENEWNKPSPSPTNDSNQGNNGNNGGNWNNGNNNGNNGGNWNNGNNNGNWNRPNRPNRPNNGGHGGNWNQGNNGGNWNRPEWNQHQAEPSPNAPSSTADAAVPTQTINTPDMGNWHANGNGTDTNTESSSSEAPQPTRKCTRKRRVRRHKRRMNHGQVGTF